MNNTTTASDHWPASLLELYVDPGARINGEWWDMTGAIEGVGDKPYGTMVCYPKGELVALVSRERDHIDGPWTVTVVKRLWDGTALATWAQSRTLGGCGKVIRRLAYGDEAEVDETMGRTHD